MFWDTLLPANVPTPSIFLAWMRTCSWSLKVLKKLMNLIELMLASIISYILSTMYWFLTGFFKVYMIQKQFRFLKLGDQEKLKWKCELTSCVSNQFNNMYSVRAMNQENRRKDYLPVNIFIDCSTSLKYFNNYYFSRNPKFAFLAH